MVFTTHLVQWLSWVFDPSTHLAHFTHPCLNSAEKPFIPLERHTQPQHISAPATTMLATNVTQDAALSLNEFALCHVLWLHLRPSLALSPCEFATFMRALVPSPVPTGIRQHFFRLGQPVLPINGRTCRAFLSSLPDNNSHLAAQGYLLLPSPRVIEYSDDILFFFPQPHLLYHPPALFPHNFTVILAVASELLYCLVWVMSRGWAQRPGLTNIISSEATTPKWV